MRCCGVSPGCSNASAWRGGSRVATSATSSASASRTASFTLSAIVAWMADGKAWRGAGKVSAKEMLQQDGQTARGKLPPSTMHNFLFAC